MPPSSADPGRIPTLLAVGCPRELLDRCRIAARTNGVAIKKCAAPLVAALVAERRPLVIVLPNEVYACDPEAFVALARSVQATLLNVDEEVSARELEVMIAGAIRMCVDLRARRDALVRGSAPEVPISERSEAALPRPLNKTIPPGSGMRPRLHSDLDGLFDEQDLPLDYRTGTSKF